MQTIKKPKLVKTSVNGRKYITVNGKVTMISDDLFAQWDNIKTIDVDDVHYAMGRDPEDPDSELSTEFAFDRQEIVDYETFGGAEVLAMHEAKLTLLARKLIKDTVLENVDAAFELAD